MKHSFVKGLVFTVLMAMNHAWASEIPSDPVSLGKALCESVDLGTPGYEVMREHARGARYKEALDAWRDRKVVELRKADLGEFGWHADQLNRKRLSFADQLAGIPLGKGATSEKADGFFDDIYGLREAGKGDRPIRWMAKDATGRSSAPYSHFHFAIPFGTRFWISGNAAYVDKFFAIAGDFSLHHKILAEHLPTQERKAFECGWTTSAPSALAQGVRVENLIRTMALMCKSLPDTGAKANWEEALAPRIRATKAGAQKTIPATGLAQVAMSLVNDHPQALLARYLEAGAVPNQRRSGLCALVMIGTQFHEFKASKILLTQAYAGFDDYLEEMFQPDGGMLEQSFNYNLGDASGFKDVAKLLKVNNPGLAAKMTEKQKGFYQMAASIMTPFAELPAMSSQSPPNPPEIWKDAKLRRQWMEKPLLRIREWEQPTADRIAAALPLDRPAAGPGFTSVAFPFSGYYVQRGDWTWKSPYLFFQGSRQSRGHQTLGNNAIQVSAYGRPLIVSAGAPVYFPEQLPPERRSEFTEINELVGEHSTWKTNTILVDRSSQHKSATPAQKAFKTPVAARWYASSSMDFLEGHADGGYAASGTKEVRHLRQVVFVRDPGLWVVVDVMLSADASTHAYTQNWILPGNETDGRTKVTGFRKAEVKADESLGMIRTEDPHGPNLTLRHVGLQPGQVRYAHHYGAKNPWRGWLAVAFGQLLPAHQIEANFSASGNATLITIIQPRQTGDTKEMVVTELSQKNSATSPSCRIALSNGRVLSVFARDTEGEVQAPAFSGAAQLVVTIENGGNKVEGLVIKGRESAGSHAFEARPGKATTLTPILGPSQFSWIKSATGIAPSYSGDLGQRRPPSLPGTNGDSSSNKKPL